MFGAFTTLAPVSSSANVPASGLETQTATMESAIEAYQAGNISQALTLAKSAAGAGSTDGAVMAGRILHKGEAGTVDLEGAKKLYEKAAIFNHPDALVALGEMGIRGQAGLTKADAVSYLTRASDMGRTDAMRALADLYRHRTGRGAKRRNGAEISQTSLAKF